MNFPSDSVLLPAKKYLPLPAVPARTNEVPVSFYQTKYKKKIQDKSFDLFPPLPGNQKPVQKNMLVCDTLVPSYFDGSYIISHNTRWADPFYHFIVFFILGLFAYLAFLKIFFGKYLVQICSAGFNPVLSERLFRDKSALFEKAGFHFSFLFILTGGLFVTFGLPVIFPLSPPMIARLAISMAVIFIYLVFRFLSIKITGFLLNKSHEFDEYAHLTFIYYKTLGVVFLPLIFLLIFLSSPVKIYLVYLGIAIVGIMFILMIFRGLLLLLQKKILLFYTILYICTIEILPLLIAGKYLMRSYAG